MVLVLLFVTLIIILCTSNSDSTSTPIQPLDPHVPRTDLFIPQTPMEEDPAYIKRKFIEELVNLLDEHPKSIDQDFESINVYKMGERARVSWEQTGVLDIEMLAK